MGEENKFLSAKEARARADFSYALKNRVYKRIKESSGENYSEMEWCVKQQSTAAVNDLIADLREKGYSVDFKKYYDNSGVLSGTDEDTVVIRW